jgi:hypothetical protein
MTIERTEQGDQIVLPGAEQSARQAAEAREALSRGRMRAKAPQQPPGGLFDVPAPVERGLFD